MDQSLTQWSSSVHGDRSLWEPQIPLCSKALIPADTLFKRSLDSERFRCGPESLELWSWSGSTFCIHHELCSRGFRVSWRSSEVGTSGGKERKGIGMVEELFRGIELLCEPLERNHTRLEGFCLCDMLNQRSIHHLGRQAFAKVAARAQFVGLADRAFLVFSFHILVYGSHNSCNLHLAQRISALQIMHLLLLQPMLIRLSRSSWRRALQRSLSFTSTPPV